MWNTLNYFNNLNNLIISFNRNNLIILLFVLFRPLKFTRNTKDVEIASDRNLSTSNLRASNFSIWYCIYETNKKKDAYKGKEFYGTIFSQTHRRTNIFVFRRICIFLSRCFSLFFVTNEVSEESFPRFVLINILSHALCDPLHVN